MKNYAPVIYDATHSLQMPSAANGISGGAREFIPALLKFRSRFRNRRNIYGSSS